MYHIGIVKKYIGLFMSVCMILSMSIIAFGEELSPFAMVSKEDSDQSNYELLTKAIVDAYIEETGNKKPDERYINLYYGINELMVRIDYHNNGGQGQTLNFTVSNYDTNPATQVLWHLSGSSQGGLSGAYIEYKSIENSKNGFYATTLLLDSSISESFDAGFIKVPMFEKSAIDCDNYRSLRSVRLSEDKKKDIISSARDDYSYYSRALNTALSLVCKEDYTLGFLFGDPEFTDDDFIELLPVYGENTFELNYAGLEDAIYDEALLPKTIEHFADMEAIKLPTAAQLERVGYKFDKWTDSTGKRVNEINAQTADGEVLTANWKENTYRINYKIKSPRIGFRVSEKVTDRNRYGYDTGTVVIKGDGVVATKRGEDTSYRLIGWSNEKNGSLMYSVGQEYQGLAGADYNDKRINLYPVWEEVN